MNIRFSMLFLLISLPICAVDSDKKDKMIDTLRDIDSDKLNQLLIPGFFIRAAEKERYLAVAKEMTNKTHQELHSYSGWDLIRFCKGVSQIAISCGCLAATYLYYKEYWDVSLWEPFPEKKRTIKCQDLSDVRHRGAVYGVLGYLAWYMMRDGFEQFSEIVDKKDRLDNHRRALQNEAVIQRIPVIDQQQSCDRNVVTL